MDKKAILAFALSFLVLIVFQIFFAPEKTEVTQQTQETANVTEQKSEHPAVENSEPIKIEAAESKPMAETAATLDVSNGLINIKFNEETGNIASAQVTEYSHHEIGTKVFEPVTGDYMKVELPFSAAYSSEVNKQKDSTVVTFTASQNEFFIKKTYIIKDGSYLIDSEIEITNTGDKTFTVPFAVSVGPGLGDGFVESKYLFQGPLMYDGKKVRDEKPHKVDEILSYETPEWIGYTSKYFLFAVAADSFENGKFVPSGNSAVIKAQRDFLVHPGAKEKYNYKVFAGPKEYDLLKELGLNFEKSIEFGIFSFLSIPLLKIMNFIYGYVANYGIAIIILTLLIKIVTFPLTNKSMISMKRMQMLQPKMAEIKEKYGADKQKMNTAVMELYKKEGVNPFGGCFPILMQIPIFIALYKTLLVSIELTGAPFFGWITDLSAKDPYYITPVLMGVTMFLQQKMTPQTGDPMQQKIFMFMPIIFTFLFLNFPAGLVVYWLTNNILSIGQQYLINKKLSAQQ